MQTSETRIKLAPTIQRLDSGAWIVERTFRNFKAFRLYVWRHIEKGNAVESMTLFRNHDGSGCVELFFPGHVIGQCPFLNGLFSEAKLRRWTHLGKPNVVVYNELKCGEYERLPPKTWRW